MASTLNDALTALAAISNIINRETEILKAMAIADESSRNKVPTSTDDRIMESIKEHIIENNIRVEQLESKLSSMIQPQPVVDLTKVFATLESIEERLKKLETAPVPTSPPVQVDPDIVSKVKAISASFDAAINKIEAKVDIIEAAIEEVVVEEKKEAAVVEEVAVEEEDAVEEAADEEAAEEEEEEELTEFRYKGKDYYMDAECNVYEADEEGNPTLVGVYNEVTRKITFNN